MRKIAIVTDSNSGITQDEGRKLGISVLPMPFYINEVMYLEGVTLSQEEFYERLKKDEPISTSQPNPGEVCGLWDTLLKEYNEIVHIPMSSGLSASCETAMGLARDYNGKVQVVDNQRISVTQKQSVMDALTLVQAGKSAAEIREILEAERRESRHLYYAGNSEISQKRRTYHTGSRSDRYSSESETGTADPGRQAGRLFKGQRKEAGQKSDAEGHERGFRQSFCRICKARRNVSGDGIYGKSGRSRGIQKRGSGNVS